MAAYKAIVHLTLSEAQWDLFPEQSGEACEAEFEIPLPDGPWVQFTYGGLMMQDGLGTDLFFGNDNWAYTGDGRVWSDVVIEIVEA